MSTLTAEDRDELPDGKFAFPKQRKGPIEDAAHVRNAIARFNQIKGVTDAEHDDAWRRIVRAAKRFDVEVNEQDWREIGARKSR